ncbi:hypothetical protein N665_0338s0041 [Sinapis alba]|nr:hypothetical protein N665_0338s0041 [Sinapis alba]
MPPEEAVAVTDSRQDDSSQDSQKSAPLTRSWVKVAQQNQKGLTKYDVQITMEDGIGSVEVPEEIFKDPQPLWEDFLIGKFLDKAPHIGKVHAIVNKIWASNKTQMIEVYEINPTTMKFRILDSVMRGRVLRRGMWNLAEVPVVMSEWKPFIEEEELHSSVPLWVQLKNVPMNMFSWKGLSFATSPIGVPVKLHPDTALCKDFKVAKVFVKADLTKALPRSMNFKFQGKDTLIEFSYPWLPTKCTTCGKWGHSEKVCLKQKETGKEETEDKMEALCNQEAQKDPIGPESGEIEQPVAEEVCSSDGKGKENDQEENWSTPVRVSRTPEKTRELEIDRDSILSNSRFAVLSSEEEEGEIMQKETATEVEEIPPQPPIQKKHDVQSKPTSTRPSLPRISKDNHRLISNSSAPKTTDCGQSLLDKKSTKK